MQIDDPRVSYNPGRAFSPEKPFEGLNTGFHASVEAAIAAENEYEARIAARAERKAQWAAAKKRLSQAWTAACDRVVAAVEAGHPAPEGCTTQTTTDWGHKATPLDEIRVNNSAASGYRYDERRSIMERGQDRPARSFLVASIPPPPGWSPRYGAGPNPACWVTQNMEVAAIEEATAYYDAICLR